MRLFCTALLLVLLVLPAKVMSSSAYPQCGTNFGCFGSDSNCITNGGCKMMAAYQYDATNNQINFMIQGNGQAAGKYVALGISTDNMMGSDMVFVCTNGNPSTVLTTWNAGKSNVVATNVNIINPSSAVLNTVVTCNFTVATSISPTANGQTVSMNLASTNYYLLLAEGSISGTTLYQHDQVTSSSTAFDLKVSGMKSDANLVKSSVAFLLTGLLVFFMTLSGTGMN